MFSVWLAGDHLYGKWLFTWLSLVMSLMVSYFVLFFFPRDELAPTGKEIYLLLLTHNLCFRGQLLLDAAAQNRRIEYIV